jgi:hypothetical protein
MAATRRMANLWKRKMSLAQRLDGFLMLLTLGLIIGAIVLGQIK